MLLCGLYRKEKNRARRKAVGPGKESGLNLKGKNTMKKNLAKYKVSVFTMAFVEENDIEKAKKMALTDAAMVVDDNRILFDVIRYGDDIEKTKKVAMYNVISKFSPFKKAKIGFAVCVEVNTPHDNKENEWFDSGILCGDLENGVFTPGTHAGNMKIVSLHTSYGFH